MNHFTTIQQINPELICRTRILGRILSWQDVSSCLCRVDRKHQRMARVLRATANLKEAISKTEVQTHRNLIKRSHERATEPWIGNARNSTVTLKSKSGRMQGKFSILSREVL